MHLWLYLEKGSERHFYLFFFADEYSTNIIITADRADLYLGRKYITKINRFFRHSNMYIPNPAIYIIF